MPRIATLDARGRLIGATTAQRVRANEIDPGDLPTDGSYFYDKDRKAFLPVGTGAGKPSVPPVDRDKAFYLLVRALTKGQPIPQECAIWADWYERYHAI